MTPASSSSSFFVPREAPHRVARSAAIELLNAPGAALRVVVGPGGSGKSTLLASWTRSLQTPGTRVWVAVNDEDNGRWAFWSRVGRDLAASGVLDPGSDLVAVNPQTMSEASLRPLLQRVFGSLQSPLTLVIDDFHLVGSVDVEQDIVAVLINSPQLEIAVGSRTAGTLTSSEVAARVQTVLVSGADLSFTRAETAALARLQDAAADEAVIDSVYERSSGWALAVHALLREEHRTGAGQQTGQQSSGQPSQQPSQQFAQLGREHGAFANGLAQRIADRSTRASSEIVLRSAWFESCPLSLGIALTGASETEVVAVLDELEHDGYGVWHPGVRERTFRFHPLLRSSLRELAVRRLSLADRSFLDAALCDWLSAADRPLAALQVAAAAKDWKRAEDVFRDHVAVLLVGKTAPLRAVLHQVPNREKLEHPLLSAADLLLEYSSPATPLARLKRNLSVLAAAIPKPLGFAITLDNFVKAGLAMSAYRLLGDASSAARLADRTMAIFDAVPVATRDRARSIVAMIVVQVGITRLYLGQLDEAEAAFRAGIEAAQELAQSATVTHGQSLLAFTAVLRGDVPSARRELELCETLTAPLGWRDSYIGAGYRLARAQLALEAGDPLLAKDELGALGEHEDTIEHWPYLSMIRARADLMMEAPEVAQQALATSMQRKHNRPSPIRPLGDQLAAVSADIHLVLGATAKADRLLRGRSAGAAVLLARARVALALGRNDQAAAALDEVVQTWGGLPQVTTEALLLGALADAGRGSRGIPGARAKAAAGFAMLREFQLTTPALLIPRAEIEALLGGPGGGPGDVPGDEAGEESSGGAGAARADLALLERLPAPLRSLRRVEPLTDSELRVLIALRDTERVGDAADRLYVSPNTVKHHTKNVYRKLGVGTRNEAIETAKKLGIL